MALVGYAGRRHDNGGVEDPSGNARMAATEVAGITLDVIDVGNGPPVMFLRAEHFMDQQLDFATSLAMSARVLTPGYPGFDGRAVADDIRSVEDLTYLYLQLLDDLELDRVTLIGSSIGGWIALEMAVRCPGRFAGLLLLSPLGVKLAARDERQFADLAAMPTNEAFAGLFGDQDKAPDFARYSAAQMEAIGRERQYLAYFAWNPYLHNPRLKRWLSRVNMPVELLWGGADRMQAPHYGEQLQSLLPDAELTVLPGIGHMPQLEDDAAVGAAFARLRGRTQTEASA